MSNTVDQNELIKKIREIALSIAGKHNANELTKLAIEFRQTYGDDPNLFGKDYEREINLNKNDGPKRQKN